jgi:hypothetical protein
VKALETGTEKESERVSAKELVKEMETGRASDCPCSI